MWDQKYQGIPFLRFQNRGELIIISPHSFSNDSCHPRIQSMNVTLIRVVILPWIRQHGYSSSDQTSTRCLKRPMPDQMLAADSRSWSAVTPRQARVGLCTRFHPSRRGFISGAAGSSPAPRAHLWRRGFISGAVGSSLAPRVHLRRGWLHGRRSARLSRTAVTVVSRSRDGS